MKPALIIILTLLFVSACNSNRDLAKKENKQMKFGYTIIYVRDVAAAVGFYEKAFGLSRRFVHESGQYAEMETGATTLAFTANELAAENITDSFTENKPSEAPAGIEIAFTSEDVEMEFARAVKAGATVVREPVTKPWGQVVGYVRNLNGVIVEIGSPVE
jgi:uncharacterized glyoxalase superfamily protein PhnB